MTAREFAIKAHGAQRYGEFPYEKHLAMVHDTLITFGMETDALLAAAWLHDAIEDADVSGWQIMRDFGAEVAFLVQAVTNEQGKNRAERAALTYPNIREYGRDAVILKLADRIANTEHSIASQTRHLEMYRREFHAFEAALFVAGEADAMWAHLRAISTEAV